MMTSSRGSVGADDPATLAQTMVKTHEGLRQRACPFRRILVEKDVEALKVTFLMVCGWMGATLDGCGVPFPLLKTVMSDYVVGSGNFPGMLFFVVACMATDPVLRDKIVRQNSDPKYPDGKVFMEMMTPFYRMSTTGGVPGMRDRSFIADMLMAQSRSNVDTEGFLVTCRPMGVVRERAGVIGESKGGACRKDDDTTERMFPSVEAFVMFMTQFALKEMPFPPFRVATVSVV